MRKFLALRWVNGDTTYYLTPASGCGSWSRDIQDAARFAALGELLRFVQGMMNANVNQNFSGHTNHFTSYGLEGDQRYQIVEVEESPRFVEKRRLV